MRLLIKGISTISIFILLVALVNVALSLFVYYLLPLKLDMFLQIRWPISILAIIILLLRKNMEEL